MNKKTNRRDFLKTAAVGTAAALMPGKLFSAPILNSQVRLGFIGTGLRGQWILSLVAKYPEVKISNMLFDNVAMQLVQDPKQFDVILSSNLFGDILSDISSILSGSIGMLPSASLDQNSKGLYEPVHGTAPDIAGKAIANPLAAILSIAMMFKYSFNNELISSKIEETVKEVLSEGFATQDIASENSKIVSTSDMGDLIIENLK